MTLKLMLKIQTWSASHIKIDDDFCLLCELHLETNVSSPNVDLKILTGPTLHGTFTKSSEVLSLSRGVNVSRVG